MKSDAELGMRAWRAVAEQLKDSIVSLRNEEFTYGKSFYIKGINWEEQQSKVKYHTKNVNLWFDTLERLTELLMKE